MSELFDDSETKSSEPIVVTKSAPREAVKNEEKPKTERQPPYNVILFNDEEHSFEYVIELLIKLFKYAKPKAEELTLRIHLTGRAIVMTTHRELAELKREQVLSYGPDPYMSISKGPLACAIEAAI